MRTILENGRKLFVITVHANEFKENEIWTKK